MAYVIRFLAVINHDAIDVDTNNVWANNNEIMIETIFGIFLTVAGGGDKSVDPASVIIKGIQTTNKIIEKKEKDELDASIHEEVYQMTKDGIYKLGGLK